MIKDIKNQLFIKFLIVLNNLLFLFFYDFFRNYKNISKLNYNKLSELFFNLKFSYLLLFNRITINRWFCQIWWDYTNDLILNFFNNIQFTFTSYAI